MKAQAALEFLMTYGWALIIVAAVLAVLIGMRVFSPATVGPGCNPCFPQVSAVRYVDHNKDTLVLEVLREINNVRAIVRETSVLQPQEGTGPFSVGNRITFTSPDLFKGDVPVTIEYQDVASQLSHNVTAVLHGA